MAARDMIIPSHFFDIPYKGSAVPGIPIEDIRSGANCQVFAYEVLRLNGKPILPPFRSSELWADEAHTFQVDHIQPLDLILIHSKPAAFGAHVGVAVSSYEILHLSKNNGFAKVEKLADLLLQPQYAYLIGVKRVTEVNKQRT